MVTLKEVKDYLRVDFDDDDKLLNSFILTAEQLCMDVGRMTKEELAENEDTVRMAMLYTISYLYENRNNADFKKLTLTLRALLFAQREEKYCGNRKTESEGHIPRKHHRD